MARPLSVTISTKEQRQRWEEVILDAARVSEVYNVDFRLPTHITVDDLQALTLLIAII
jgi:hypothetical protein